MDWNKLLKIKFNNDQDRNTPGSSIRATLAIFHLSTGTGQFKFTVVVCTCLLCNKINTSLPLSSENSKLHNCQIRKFDLSKTSILGISYGFQPFSILFYLISSIYNLFKKLWYLSKTSILGISYNFQTFSILFYQSYFFHICYLRNYGNLHISYNFQLIFTNYFHNMALI